MKFLDATSDIAFKKLFGDKNHLDLTISFINSILGRKPGELIVKISLENTENLPRVPGDKKTFLDINCIDESGTEYIVEMQFEDKKNFLQRAQYYVSYALTRQLKSKDDFKKLHPVIFVGILGYTAFFDTDDYISHHHMLNIKTRICSLKHSEYHFVELEKFNKTVEQLGNNLADQWIYLIKNSGALKTMPQQFEQSKEIVEAFERLEFERLTNAEREAYIANMEAEMSTDLILQAAVENAVEKGKLQQSLAIAKNLLEAGMSVEQVAKITGLSIVEINSLVKK
jgi:predicted transposase/invertase (TIGR01784 family)